MITIGTYFCCLLNISFSLTWGGMVVVGAERDCCAVASSGGAFGSASSPGAIAACVGVQVLAAFLDLKVLVL